MGTRTSWTVVLISLGVSGCASQVPHPKSYPVTTQLNPKASQHWDAMADDVVSQTRASIEKLGGLGNKPLYVAPTAIQTSFHQAFNNFLVTRLVNQGLPVSRRPEGAIVLEYRTQLVRHGSERNVYYPGTITALTAGLLVARDIGQHGLSPVGFAALGIGADVAASVLDSATPSKLELIVTTSMTADDRYVMRKSDVYYLDESDAALFSEPRIVPTREYRIVGGSK